MGFREDREGHTHRKHVGAVHKDSFRRSGSRKHVPEGAHHGDAEHSFSTQRRHTHESRHAPARRTERHHTREAHDTLLREHSANTQRRHIPGAGAESSTSQWQRDSLGLHARPTTSSAARSGDEAPDRWPAQSPGAQPAVKVSQKPVLRKHASKKSEDQAPSYAQMHLDKTAATQAEAAEASRSEMFGKSMRRFKVTDHLEGSAVIPASHSPDAPYAGMDARASETKTHAVAGLDVRHRRQERRHGDDHISQSATWLTDAHTPRKGHMLGANAPQPTADDVAPSHDAAGEIRPPEVSPGKKHVGAWNPPPKPVCLCRALSDSGLAVPAARLRELQTTEDMPLYENTPTAAAQAAADALLSTSGAHNNLPATPGVELEPDGKGGGGLDVEHVDASDKLRRGGLPRTGRKAGEEEFGRFGWKKPPHEAWSAAPHAWSATYAGAPPIAQRNVLTADGIVPGDDTPTPMLNHHRQGTPGDSSRLIPPPDPARRGCDTRQLTQTHEVVEVSGRPIVSVGPESTDAADVKPGRRADHAGESPAAKQAGWQRSERVVLPDGAEGPLAPPPVEQFRSEVRSQFANTTGREWDAPAKGLHSAEAEAAPPTRRRTSNRRMHQSRDSFLG